MQMSDASWRRILLHAADEQIADEVTRGALVMQLKRKSIVIENTGRFEQVRRTDTRSLADIPPLVKRRKAERLAGRCGDEAAVWVCADDEARHPLPPPFGRPLHSAQVRQLRRKCPASHAPSARRRKDGGPAHADNGRDNGA